MDNMFKTLTEIIKNHNHIYIMAHRNIDLDALGSELCLYTIIKSFKKDCHIIVNLEEDNTSIQKAYMALTKAGMTIDFVTRSNYRNDLTAESLVIVLDTHKEEMVECNTILKEVKDIVVIDHHIKSGDHIESTLFTYINANLSSINEIMVRYLQYLNKTVNATLATIMLAGIEIDTNAFNVKTAIGTYEAAAVLARLGADNIMKQELLQENKEIYMRRQELIKNSFKIGKNYELCLLDNQIYERKDLALISEELLKFENIEASFTIGRTGENKVGISARSLGRINVESFMAALGGGGHLTDAAVQLRGISIDEAENMLLKVIDGGKL